MKKKIALSVILITLLTTTLAIIIVGCTNKKITDNSSLIDQYKEVGVRHNAALDYVLQDLKCLQNENKVINKEKLVDYCNGSINEYWERNIENYNILTDNYDMNIKHLLKILSHTTKNSYLDSIIANSGLSDKQEEYLYRISDLVDIFTELTQLQESLGLIDSEVIDDLDLTDDERGLILAATSVAESSFEYWDENFYNWLSVSCDLLGVDIDTIEDPEGLSEEIWKTDLGGTIGGAAVFVWIPPVGWVLGGVAGGTAASLAEGIVQILNILF